MRKTNAEAQQPDSSPLAALAMIWASWLIACLLLGLLNSPARPPEVAAEVLVLLHTGTAVLLLGRHFERRMAIVLGLSLILRTGLVFWDLNFSHLFELPNSGADTEGYYTWAVNVAQNPTLIFDEIPYGKGFSKLFGLLFWFIGPLRVFGQYTNALFGFSILLLLASILKDLPLTEEQRNRILTLSAFLPNSLVLSAIFLRETVVAFLIAVSVFLFVRWFNQGPALSILFAAVAVLAASSFHAGVIAVGVGYMFVALFYQRDTGRFGFGFSSFLYLVFFAAIVYLVLAEYPDLFLGKFEALETADDVLTATNRRGGDSQYLTGLTVDSYADLVRFGPLRALYFLASPLPWDFRGLMDIVTFLTDSVFYVGVPLLVLVRLRRLAPRTRGLAIGLLVVLFVSSLVFGAGVSNAGTATRHRFKLISLVMVLLAIAAAAGRRSVEKRGTPGHQATGLGGAQRVRRSSVLDGTWMNHESQGGVGV